MPTFAQASEELCRVALRSFLTAACERTLKDFAAKHKQERFYCLCVYFDSTYGDFFLYLNIPERARKTASQSLKMHPDRYQGMTVEEVENGKWGKWNCGDFKYCFSNVRKPWMPGLEPVSSAFARLSQELYGDGTKPKASLAFSAMWAEIACTVALDLEQSKVLRLLRKTKDFRVICVDHDETLEESMERLKRVRATYEPVPK